MIYILSIRSPVDRWYIICLLNQTVPYFKHHSDSSGHLIFRNTVSFCFCVQLSSSTKVNSVQEAFAKCFAVHILKFEILKTTKNNHQNAEYSSE